jgi:class 3 adenylate cyclase/tetratricopeptide (TPR) repeat protein
LTASTSATARHAPYLPLLARAWPDSAPYLELDATLVSADLSGFTALSERLAQKGKEGAEELILVVSGCFEGLIGISARHGGDVLKFRGDALLLLFDGQGHAERACRAAAQMQWFIETAAPSQSSVGPVSLTMSTGVHSGTVHVFAAGTSHRELIVTGPAASETIRLESDAAAGEVLLSVATAAMLEDDWLGAVREDGRLLRLEPAAAETGTPWPSPLELQAPEEYLPAPLRSALAGGVEPEHRHVVAAFVKFSGVEGVLAVNGVDELHARLVRLAEATGSAADELGLTWLESDIDVDGGKLYLTGGAPASTGDDEDAMLHALRRIVAADTGLAVRAGVNSGVAFAGDVGASTRRTYAVTGDTVNLAARLTARAAVGEVLATSTVLDASTTRYSTQSKPLIVKGKERAVTAYSVGEPLGGKAERAHELPIVGRDAELAVFSSALDSARRRQSQLIELAGEAGIGKSRLLEELKTRAVGFQQLLASCDAYGASTPYGALHGLLRPLAGITPELSSAEAGQQLKPWIDAIMPDLSPWLPLLAIPFDATVPPTPEVEGLDATFVHAKLHEAVEQFLQRVLMMPSLIVVEDAHWLDDASAYLLRHLTRAPALVPWLTVVTRRPEGRSFVSEDYGVLLELGPLAQDAVADLALAAAGGSLLTEQELAAVGERAGGNPLFIRELVAAAKQDGNVDALPQTVETLMTARIDTLDSSDRQLLRYAAVIGASFELDLLEEVLADEVDDAAAHDRWERLREFVSWDGASRLAFNHDLFRTTAYEGLSLRRRRELHGRVAKALERRAGDAADEAASLLSLHFFEAEVYDRAWHYSVLAGRRAQQTLANVVAAELFERALAAAEQLSGLVADERAAVWESLGDVCEIFASYERARVAYGEALALAEGATPRAQLLWKTGVVQERIGEYEHAIERYAEALIAVSGDDGDDAAAVRIELELAIAGVRQRQGRFDEAKSWAERAAEHAESAGARKSLAHAYYLLDLICTNLGQPNVKYRESALPIYRETGDLVGQASVLNNLGVGAYFEGRWTEALEFYRESGEVSRRAGDVISTARASNNVAEILSDQGRLADAVELLADAQRVWRAGHYPLGAQLATSNLGRAEARAGRFDIGLQLLAEARAGFAEIGAAAFELDAQARVAECFVLAGRHQEAIEICTDALARAAEIPGGEGPRVSLERSLGYALVQARREDEAKAHLDASADLARSLNLDYELALTWKALADTGLAGDPAFALNARQALERLGVVATPEPPLP